MASADPSRIKKRGRKNVEVEEDLVEGVLQGIEDYKAGRSKTFKSKDELLDHLRSL